MRILYISAALAIAIAAGATPPAQAREAYRIKMPTIGCLDRDLVQRLRNLREDNGLLAADSIAQGALESGECTPLPAGMLVLEEDSDIVAGLTKVRAPGVPAPVWVRYATLSDDD